MFQGVVRAYQRYEYDEREPRLSVLIRVADFYGVSLDYLAGRKVLAGFFLRKCAAK